jgi:hypothetical protein
VPAPVPPADAATTLDPRPHPPNPRCSRPFADIASFPYEPKETMDISVARSRGVDVLHDPVSNKGTAHPLVERERLGLRGLLPPRVLTMEQQVGADCLCLGGRVARWLGGWVRAAAPRPVAGCRQGACRAPARRLRGRAPHASFAARQPLAGSPLPSTLLLVHPLTHAPFCNCCSWRAPQTATGTGRTTLIPRRLRAAESHTSTPVSGCTCRSCR